MHGAAALSQPTRSSLARRTKTWHDVGFLHLYIWKVFVGWAAVCLSFYPSTLLVSLTPPSQPQRPHIIVRFLLTHQRRARMRVLDECIHGLSPRAARGSASPPLVALNTHHQVPLDIRLGSPRWGLASHVPWHGSERPRGLAFPRLGGEWGNLLGLVGGLALGEASFFSCRVLSSGALSVRCPLNWQESVELSGWRQGPDTAPHPSDTLHSRSSLLHPSTHRATCGPLSLTPRARLPPRAEGYRPRPVLMHETGFGSNGGRELETRDLHGPSARDAAKW